MLLYGACSDRSEGVDQGSSCLCSCLKARGMLSLGWLSFSSSLFRSSRFHCGDAVVTPALV